MAKKNLGNNGHDKKDEVNIMNEMDIQNINDDNLKKEIEEGNFREDLYHRLAVILIPVPDLKDRKKDIPLLVDYFIAQIGKEQNMETKNFTPKALSHLNNYQWTGNIRELRNVVERLQILGDNPITVENINQFASK